MSLAVLLCACGGGGSSGEEVPSPAVLAPGSLDPDFGTGGKVITSFGANAQANGLAIAPDGRIVVGGYADDGVRHRFALARYSADGSLDSSFGASGKVIVAIGAGDAQIDAIALQSDGRIVVAGSRSDTPPSLYQSCALARFNSDGTLDAQFGDAGVVLLDFAPIGRPSCTGAAIQPDGKIVASLAGTRDVTVLRLNSNGSFDASFGTNGVATRLAQGWNAGLMASSIVVQPDGKLVVAAQTAFIFKGIAYGTAVTRFEPDGTSDHGFGQDGLVYFQNAGFSDMLQTCQVALLPDGRIIAAVGTVNRFLSTGALDASFHFQSSPGTSTSLALQPNGKIVAIGHPGFRVARFMQDGGLDPGFGDGGIIDTVIGTDRTASAGALQADGRVVVAGGVSTSEVDAAGVSVTRQNFGLVRYIGDTVAPSSQ